MLIVVCYFTYFGGDVMLALPIIVKENYISLKNMLDRYKTEQIILLLL